MFPPPPSPQHLSIYTPQFQIPINIPGLDNVELDCKQGEGDNTRGFKISTEQAGVEVFCNEAVVAHVSVAKALP